MTRLTRAAVALSALTLAASAAAVAGVVPAQAAPGAPARGATGVFADCQTLSERPTTISLACADDNTYLAKLKWQSWGSKRAWGTGVLKVNDCDPDCAGGTFVKYKARVEVKYPVTFDGNTYFTVVEVIYNDAGPMGELSSTFALPYSNLPQ